MIFWGRFCFELGIWIKKGIKNSWVEVRLGIVKRLNEMINIWNRGE